MDMKKTKRLLFLTAAVYWISVLGIFAIAQEQFRYSAVSGEKSAAVTTVGEVVDGMQLHQETVSPADVVQSLELMVGTYGRSNTGQLLLTLTDAGGAVVCEKTIDVSTLKNDQYNQVSFDTPLELGRGTALTLTINSKGCTPGNAVTLYTDGAEALCIRINGYNNLSFYRIYWILAAAAFAAAFFYVIRCLRGIRRGQSNLLAGILTLFSRYGFLIRQLVARDFKTKYKRSALGMAWSIMNPMLTMAVQYLVFSTLFKNDIPNYLVYLLTGIVFFSFFNESLTLGMTAITGNASLIKKVYMPRYIYPLSRILSSMVNFLLALVPLFLVVIVTGTSLRPSLFLLLFDIGCLLVFIIGMTLLLSTAVVFFQDTLFLWNVACLMWQYLTPIFYPESIIPAAFLPVYRLNPLYQFITFARICIIDGISPPPGNYLGCLLSALGVLTLGIVVFKRYQDKFVLYL